MGIRGELFTINVQAENRTYFFNVKENSRGDVFLQVVESKMSENAVFDRQSVVVFEDEMQPFLQGLDKCIEFIEKNKKERQKAAAKRKELSLQKKKIKKSAEESLVKKTGKVRIVRKKS